MLIIDGLSTKNEATQGCHPKLLSVFAALQIRTVIYDKPIFSKAKGLKNLGTGPAKQGTGTEHNLGTGPAKQGTGTEHNLGTGPAKCRGQALLGDLGEALLMMIGTLEKRSDRFFNV